MDRAERPLVGGNLSTVVRVGDTVRRPLAPWSPAVHALLLHLERRGFSGAPRFLGVDERGRETLSYLPGEVGRYPLPTWMWSDDVLVAAARLLRHYHDATTGFVPPPAAAWQLPPPTTGRPADVICHNDGAPYNTVFAGGLPVALIDFDTAGPGPRSWDVAYALYRWVPLTGAMGEEEVGSPPVPDRRRRLRLYCDVYGLEDRRDLTATVEQRLQALAEHVEERAAAGDLAYRRLRDDGHAAFYRREAAAVAEHRSTWQTVLDRPASKPVTTER